MFDPFLKEHHPSAAKGVLGRRCILFLLPGPGLIFCPAVNISHPASTSSDPVITCKSKCSCALFTRKSASPQPASEPTSQLQGSQDVPKACWLAGCGDADLRVNRRHEHLDLHMFQGTPAGHPTKQPASQHVPPCRMGP